MGEKYTLKPPGERTEGDWQAIPDQSSLRAKVLSAATKTMPFKERDTEKPAVRIEWVFQVEDSGSFFHRKVKGLTYTELENHPDCRFYQWVRTLLGGNDLPEGFEIDFDDFAGIECIIQVSMKETPKKDGPGVWQNNNVIDVRPARESVSVGSSSAMDDEPF